MKKLFIIFTLVLCFFIFAKAGRKGTSYQAPDPAPHYEEGYEEGHEGGGYEAECSTSKPDPEPHYEEGYEGECSSSSDPKPKPDPEPYCDGDDNNNYEGGETCGEGKTCCSNSEGGEGYCDGDGNSCCNSEGGEGYCDGNGGTCSGGDKGDGLGCSCHSNRLGQSYWSKVTGPEFELTGMTRVYYMAAEEVYWDYAPKGINGVTGQPFKPNEQVYTKQDVGRVGSKYLKCLYREYTSSSFKTLRQRPPEEAHLGFMGPTIYGEVGDIIQIVFINKCKFPASIHPHGVFYHKDSEGAPYVDGSSGADKADDAVPTGGKHTYTWRVPHRAGPGMMDGSSIMWMYHSHTNEVIDVYAGLIGNMVITRKGMLGNRKPKDLDREVFWMYSVTDESQSVYIEENIKEFALPPYNITALLADRGFATSSQKFGINGYIYGNAPLLTLKKGDRVRFYMMSMGGFGDAHTPHWHGNTLSIDGLKMNTASLLPAEMMAADMIPDSPGTWLHHCHVNEHAASGMITLYQVVDKY